MEENDKSCQDIVLRGFAYEMHHGKLFYLFEFDEIPSNKTRTALCRNLALDPNISINGMKETLERDTLNSEGNPWEIMLSATIHMDIDIIEYFEKPLYIIMQWIESEDSIIDERGNIDVERVQAKYLGDMQSV